MSRRVLALLLLVAACKSTSGPSDSPEFKTDEFDSGALSSYTKYSDFGVDPWSVGGGALRGAGLTMQSVLIRKGESVQDGWVETAIDHADDGGLVLRFADNTNYLLLAIRDDSSMGGSPFSGDFPSKNLEIYQRTGPGQDGFRSLWQHDLVWPRGQQKIIRFEANGDTLKVLVDGGLIVALHAPIGHAGTGLGLRHQGTEPHWVNRYEWLRWSK